MSSNGVDGLFTFSVDTDVKVKIDRPALIASKQILDNFYNEYSDKQIDIGVNGNDLKRNVSKLNDDMHKYIRNVQQYIFHRSKPL